MGWYGSGAHVWKHRAEIISDHTQVAEDITDFTADVKITTTEWPKLANARPNGGDILFTESDGTTKLNHTIISFDGTTLVAKVKCDLDTDNDTYIYIYCGCSTCLDQQASSGMYESEIRGAWSMDKSASALSSFTSLWLTKPRAAFYSGTYNRTYVAHLNYTETEIQATYYDHDSDLWATPVKVADAPAQDAHNSPTLMVDSDGYLYVTWPDNQSGGCHIKKSSSAESISAWGSDLAPVSAPTSTIYAATLKLSDDTLVCIYISGNTMNRIISANDGSTWTNSQLLVDITSANDSLYYYATLGASDRVHVGYHIGSAATGANAYRNLWYMYSDNAGAATSSWKAADGTSLTLDLDESDTDNLVFDSVTPGWDFGYIAGIDVDSNNKPYILYRVNDSSATDKLYVFEYSGSQWNTRTVLTSNSIGTPSDSYPGLVDGDIYVDGSTISVIFTIAESTHDEIDEYQSTDSGVNWSKNRDVTSGGSDNCYALEYPQDMTDEFRFLFMRGSDNYNNAKSIYWSGSLNAYTSEQASVVGANSIIDLTDNGFDFTNDGSDDVAGQVGRGRDFVQANNDYAYRANRVSAATQGVLAMWVNLDTLANDEYYALFGYGGGDVATPGVFYLRHGKAGTSQRLAITQRSDSGTLYSVYKQVDLTGAWHHIALASSGTAWRMYVDGVLQTGLVVQSGSNIGNWFGDTTVGETDYTSIGRLMYDGSWILPLDGIVDEIVLTNTDKTDEWIETLYNNQLKYLVDESSGFWSAGEIRDRPVVAQVIFI